MQGLVRAGVVPTTLRSLERARREISHLPVGGSGVLFGETMAELAVPRGNFVRRALFQPAQLGAIMM